ncbi:MAG: hypothetical protein DJ555_04970 [Desulfurococcaceae archaeon]|nr:MAG: hypothetical protein DJ555_04970 [Desulfurococcaceae archaeon]
MGYSRVKIYRGSLVIDTSMIKLLDDRGVSRLLEYLVKISLGDLYRVFIAVSPFNANITYRGSRVYRVSISYGAFIISPSTHDTNPRDLGEVFSTICNEGEDANRLCWYLSEDVWADVRILVPKISLDPLDQCSREYGEPLARLGLSIARDARSRILCLARGDRLTINDPDASYLIIPTGMDSGYKDYLVDHVGGYRHPIAALLMGRRVRCGDQEDLELPKDSEIIVRSSDGNALLYNIYDIAYVFGCKPWPEDLLFKIPAIYASTVAG